MGGKFNDKTTVQSLTVVGFPNSRRKMVNLQVNATFTEAKNLCAQVKMSLPSINNARELQRFRKACPTKDCFLGMTRDAAGSWVWADGAPNVFRSWRSKKDRQDRNPKARVVLDRKTGKWKASTSAAPRGVVCASGSSNVRRRTRLVLQPSKGFRTVKTL